MFRPKPPNRSTIQDVEGILLAPTTASSFLLSELQRCFPSSSAPASDQPLYNLYERSGAGFMRLSPRLRYGVASHYSVFDSLNFQQHRRCLLPGTGLPAAIRRVRPCAGVLVSAFLVVYLVLSAQYESFTSPRDSS